MTTKTNVDFFSTLHGQFLIIVSLFKGFHVFYNILMLGRPLKKR